MDRQTVSLRIAVTPQRRRKHDSNMTVPPPVSPHRAPILLRSGSSSEPEEVMYIIGCLSNPPPMTMSRTAPPGLKDKGPGARREYKAPEDAREARVGPGPATYRASWFRWV